MLCCLVAGFFFDFFFGKQFVRPMRFLEAEALEESFEDISKEFDQLVAKGHLAMHPESLSRRKGDWRVFTMWSSGKEHEDNTAVAAVTSALWKRLQAQLPRTRQMTFGLTYFSVLVPGAELAEHFGLSNMRIRIHLGLRVPNGGIRLKLANSFLEWKEGKCIIFDDR